MGRSLYLFDKEGNTLNSQKKAPCEKQLQLLQFSSEKKSCCVEIDINIDISC